MILVIKIATTLFIAFALGVFYWLYAWPLTIAGLEERRRLGLLPPKDAPALPPPKGEKPPTNEELSKMAGIPRKDIRNALGQRAFERNGDEVIMKGSTVTIKGAERSGFWEVFGISTSNHCEIRKIGQIEDIRLIAVSNLSLVT